MPAVMPARSACAANEKGPFHVARGDCCARFQLRATPTGPDAAAKTIGAVCAAPCAGEEPPRAWTTAHFEAPIVMGGLSIGRFAVLSDPAAIRHVLLENSHNYKKDWLQHRV